jgi:hypothetical protein
LLNLILNSNIKNWNYYYIKNWNYYYIKNKYENMFKLIYGSSRKKRKKEKERIYNDYLKWKIKKKIYKKYNGVCPF